MNSTIQATKSIPLLDLKAQYAAIQPEIDAAMAEVIQNTSFIGGRQLAEFEEAFADYQGTKHAVAVASGTGAIFLALRALDIQPGDEIITTPHSFIATIEPIEEVGAVPVFVDVDPRTYNIDVSQIEAAITDRTRAIMPVHLYGQMAEMDAICEIARKHDLLVIEDAAQAHGARFAGKRAGQWGDAAIFSFYPGKNLGAFGDAGGLCTNRDGIAEKVGMLRNHGRTKKYEHDIIGYGERCDTLQAAILNVKLAHLNDWNVARREHAAAYTEALSELSRVKTPYVHPEAEPVFHVYCIQIEGDRDAVLSELKSRGVGAAIHYPIPLHLQPALRHRNYQPGSMPVCEYLADHIISLPIYPELTALNRETVIAELVDVVGGL